MSDDAKADTKMTPKPVAGKDTPAADDIITPCAGGCGRWMVAQHPSHVRGGRALDPRTGEMRDWSPTPEWAEAEAERMASGGTSCLSCGPVEVSDEESVERERINALRDFSRADRSAEPSAHDCMDNAVPYESDGPLGHGWECGICGAFLQAG